MGLQDMTEQELQLGKEIDRAWIEQGKEVECSIGIVVTVVDHKP